jgi:predicted phosphodiesterase
MRIALIADIHSNLHALEACLEHATEQGAERFAFLGDLVGYGAYPAQVVDRIMALADQGALVVKGNHDVMAVHPPALIKQVGDQGAAWTHAQLSDAQRDWLSKLPMSLRCENLLVVHASADQPERWPYVRDVLAAQRSLDAASAQWPEVRYVAGGHVHEQNLFYRGVGNALMAFLPWPGAAIPVPAHRQWLFTAGSAGQPRDGKTGAMYALLDNDKSQLRFYRVPYDSSAAAAAIRAVGLPAQFALRLEGMV